jgi:hypothetical protein
MKSNDNSQNIGLGIIVVVIIGLITWALFHEISQAPWQFISVFGVLLGTLINVTGNFQSQILSDQKVKKIEVYDRVIKFFYDFTLAEKLGNQPKSRDELLQGLSDIKPDLILWASDNVLSLYIEFQQNINDELFSQLILSMRKDLGHQNNGLNQSKIVHVFTNIENL